MVNDDIQADKELFQRIALGDEAAFSTLFRTYSNTLYTQAFKLLKSEFWAEETVQDVFIRIWTGRSGLPAIDSPGAYLFRMVVNKALDRIRKERMEVKKQYLINQQAHHSHDGNRNTEDPLNSMDQLLQEAINELPAQRKLIYQLKYQQGLSYDEIASQLSISKHTVRNQMAKALQSLRAALSEKGDFLSMVLFFMMSN